MKAILLIIFFATIFNGTVSIRFILKPKDVYVYNSNDTKFTCLAEGELNITYVWLKDGKSGGNNRWQAYGATLYYNSVKAKDNGVLVTCQATDSTGTAIQASATIHVYNRSTATFPLITTGPSDVEAESGANVNFTCTAYGVMGDIRWIHRDLELNTFPDLRDVTTYNDGLNITSTLSLIEVYAENNGVYVCEAFGTPFYVEGFDSKNATLIVRQSPVIISISHNVFATEGQEMNATCVFSGYPEPIITWVDVNDTIVNRGSSWIVSNVAIDIEGEYRCIGKNIQGTTYSFVSITVYSIPRIISVFDELLDISFGDELQLECTAIGRPSPDIFWYKDDNQLTANNRLSIEANYLLIGEVNREDQGSYYCIAGNTVGNISSDQTFVKVHTIPIPPSGLEIVEITHESAKLHWIPIVSTDPVFQFEVIVMDKSYSFPLQNISIPTDSLTTVNGFSEYTIQGLSAYTYYHIWIQAINDIGASEFSQFELFQTKTWFPSPPIVRTRNITPFSVDIQIISDESALNGPYEGVNLTITSQQEGLLTDTRIFNSSSQLTIYSSLYDLIPYHKYTLTAYTFNGDYYSETSTVTFLTLESQPGTPPSKLQVNCTSSSVCVLNWEQPKEPNGLITSYTLTIENLGLTESHITSFTVRNDSNFYIAEDLTPYSSYSWRILASTRAGAGPQGTRRFRTPQGVPSDSPILTVETVNSTAIRLTWLKLDINNLNGEFHHYQILYTYTGINGKNINKTLIIPSNRGVTISNLNPYTNYGFSIRVNAGIGYGPYSINPIHKITFSEIPDSVVDNFTAISFTPNSVFLKWKQIPKNLIYASTANYRIEIKSHDNWLELDEVTYTKNLYNVNYLQPNTLYFFRIQLFNYLGSAPYSKEINITTQQTIPLVPIVTGSLGANSLEIILEITPQNSTTGDIIEYEVKVNEIGERVIDIRTIIPLDIHDTTHIIYNATNYFTFYKFTISAKTTVGFGEPAIYLIESGQAAPSVPPQRLIALPQTSTSVHLSWEPIPDSYLNGELTGYLIRYNTVLHQNWVYLNHTQSTFKLVTDLDKYTVYTFQVAGDTIAIGEYSNLASNRTLPDTPGEIQSVSLIKAKSNILRIRWEPPSEPNGIISQYRIKVVQDRINDLAIHASTLNSIILRDLSPYTQYTLQVAATNQIDTGPYSNEFIFTTKEDTPSKPIISQVYRQGYQLTVSWHTPYDPNGLIIDYNLTCFLLSASDTPSSTRKITILHKSGIYSYSASCTQLTPNSVYLIELSVRNSFNTSWTSAIKNTDYLPPKIVDSTSTKPEIINERIFTLPKFSKTVGKISFYLIVVLVYDPLTTTIDILTTNQSIYSLLAYALTSDSSKPENYIAANFTPTDYGLFNLGDNELYGDYRNIPLEKGYGYTFYVKACVNSINQNRFLATSSSLSEPIIIPKEIPANDQISAISAVVAVSTILLCLLICIFVILISVFCARIRSKRKCINSSNNLISKQHFPYQPCDTEYNSVPWSANVNFKKSFKGIDPISTYRSTANDPQLDARAPVPAFMLPKILEDLTADDELRLSEEYSYLIPIDTSTTILANAEINVKKNRYLNILPYDHNRVCLQVNSKTDSDYINASFIDGADKKNAYIATQGPTESTLEDFWQMVYEQHVQSLVMVTKLKEKGVDKCIQYWPTKNTNIFGKYKITLLSTSVYCDYIVRKLLLGKIATNKESRVIYHFQFISWPDHGVPLHPLPMLNFLKRVHQTMNRKLIVTQNPILVHCSAGVGRTGTFIVLDSMLKRMISDKDVDIFGHVAYLRTQRMFMVQGEDQYLFIYKVLAECYTSHKTEIPLKIIDSVYSNLTVVDPNTQKSGFEFEFNLLERKYEKCDFSSADDELNKQKNRYTQIIPYENSRVKLPILNEQRDTDYVNASFIDGYICKQQFIATQTPLANTIPDFWRMIWQEKSPIIVMITTQSSDFDECYFPEKLQIYDKFQVEKTSDRSNKDNYIYQQFSVMNISTGEARTISHFQYSPFTQLNKSFSARALLLLCQEIANMYQSVSSGPITVHCNNGSGNTGMLIAVMNLLEELKEARNINISQTVHYLRSQRPFMLQTVEQYHIIYEAMLQQVKSSIENISRRASGIEEYTPPTSPVKMSTFSKTRDSINSFNSLPNRLSYTNNYNYRNSLASNSSAYSNYDEVLETSS
ncbi:Receptor-type tyrosine-protein phosphatase delta isoform X12 [Oopsacas minuta]|uniref:protein-tyrosine-phosphatase n=1 Tax=Oopsacas minuta TaxID=111878 RepID=A0AAV7JUE8_9METZ|nr:Receptor-type tyrosine-protein phosphatase delta isoform X12 [Oopsacas minuta]